MASYLAIDIGASGGRHILGHSENGRLVLEEVYRFGNGPVRRGGSLVWDVEGIYREIAAGLKRCGVVPRSIAIDTWGVDYALIDKAGALVEPVYSYRDGRSTPWIEKTPFDELYGITGIAKNPFNTIYQLLADKAGGRLEKAARLLMLPEYFSRRLTGDLAAEGPAEYTNASTTGLLDARARTWAFPLIDGLGLPRRLFSPVREPVFEAGELGVEAWRAPVLMAASHDTASAVAVTGEDALYISSGTWSLLGIHGGPFLGAGARDSGYTNEGGYNGGIRFLKNIMGLWMLQRIREELNFPGGFAGLEAAAREAESARTLREIPFIDVNREDFLCPPSMAEAVRTECRRTGQPTPETPGELALWVYHSLARCYQSAIADLEILTGKTYPAISIIGGGSKDGFLNALTARYTGKPVFAGPAEATALGNILAQMRYWDDPAVRGGFSELIKNSFEIREFLP